MPELFVVMPVYNEQVSAETVVIEWFEELEKWTKDFVFLAVDDGSTDGTEAVLHRLQARLGPRLSVLRQKNRGHGQSCLRGYREALAARAAYILQIDSDGQCDPRYFSELWRQRASYDVVYGQRRHRADGWRRVLASQVLRLLLIGCFRVRCVDANVPYRLMRTPSLRPVLPRIPADFVLANVALAVLLKKDGTVRHGAVPIGFRKRSGGEPSVKFGKFAAKAIELHQQLTTMLTSNALAAGPPAEAQPRAGTRPRHRQRRVGIYRREDGGR